MHTGSSPDFANLSETSFPPPRPLLPGGSHRPCGRVIHAASLFVIPVGSDDSCRLVASDEFLALERVGSVWLSAGKAGTGAMEVPSENAVSQGMVLASLIGGIALAGIVQLVSAS
jgi:hypothetical protein